MENFTDKLTSIIEESSVVAMSQQHQKIMPEHILLAMLSDGDNIVRNLVTIAGGNASLLEAKTRDEIAKLPQVSGSGSGTPSL